MELRIKRVSDFALTGDGAADAWSRAEWQPMTPVDAPDAYPTRAKLVWSEKGLYFLVDCEDEHLHCTLTEDNANLFKEDVVEIFVQPDETQRAYIEYEISPLDYELPLMVINSGKRFHGWLPWHYEGPRRIRHAAAVRGGPQQSMAKIAGWSVEGFIPFALMVGLGDVPPRPGSVWRANIYRIDHDHGSPQQWQWCPDTDGNFHHYPGFGRLIFEK